MSVPLVGAMLGLVVGSFLNVVAYRVPLGRSIVRPASACTTCGSEVRARDNIPVLSWLLLRGRCRECGSAISARYPIVEFATGAIFALVPIVIGVTWALPAFWWFAAVGIVLVLTDLDHRRIPNRILLPAIAVGTALLGLAAVVEGDLYAFRRAVAGGAGYFGFLLIIALVSRGGFGFGDVKLAFLLGEFLAFVSWRVLLVGVFAAFVLGGVVAFGLLVGRRVGRKDAIPFGPALIGGAFLAVSAGERIADWYTG